MTKRFDRKHNEKIHMQTLCAMSELDYNQKSTHDYVQLFQTAQQLDMDYDTMDQIFLRMVFNIIMCNNDDHSKNHAFLYEDNTWNLSPAYDLTYAMNPDSEWLCQHLMGVNGKFSSVTTEDMLSIGQKFFVRNPSEIIKKVKTFSKKWAEFAMDAGMSDEEIKRVEYGLENR